MYTWYQMWGKTYQCQISNPEGWFNGVRFSKFHDFSITFDDFSKFLSLTCSWSIACQRCSNYIFILDLTPGFNGLGKDNCKTRWETFQFLDLVQLIFDVWWYICLITYFCAITCVSLLISLCRYFCLITYFCCQTSKERVACPSLNLPSSL